MKKVLLLTYYWPPSGKATLHWPLNIIKHLPEFGWQPSVLTIDEDTFSHKDESLLKEISPALQIIKSKVFEPFNLYRKFLGKEKSKPLIASETISIDNKGFKHKLSIWIRMNLFVPDARIGWYPYAVKAGKQLMEKENFDAIVSIGPPHSTHLVALRLSKLFNVPLYPVFIDPWVDIVYYKNFKRNRFTLSIDNYFEKKVLAHAKKAIFVTSSMKEDYVRKYDFLNKKSAVLYWGYNEEEFASLKKEKTSDTKTILHAGNIFDYQNIKPFWRQVKKEIDGGSKLRLKFIGTVGSGIKQSISEAGLDGNVDYAGFLPYSQVPQEMMNADFLLVCATEKRHLPGKMFEYLRTGNPVIAFGNDNSEMENILASVNAGKLFSYNESGEEVFSLAEDFKSDMRRIILFSRHSISHLLSKILLEQH